MKKLISCLILLAVLISGSASGEEFVRLHVIGETDLPADQQYKLQVRDWVLEYIRKNGYDDTQALEAHLNAKAESLGHAAVIRAERGVFPYPESEYNGRTYPAGDFDALRIRIGRAEGRNWWGLLYPEHICEDEEVIYYSAIVNWLMELLGLE